jgi:hypothetical protein
MRQNNSETQTNGRDPETGRFLTGNNGGGRPKGSRNKLGEQFLADLHAEWKKSGPAALKAMAENDPSGFVRVVANILPRELDFALTTESELFRDCTDFLAAYRLARQHIGAEDNPPMIDLTPEPAGHEREQHRAKPIRAI